MHPVHAVSTALSGSLVVELDEQGRPDLEAPYSARLRVAVVTLRSGNSLQDREMYRRLDEKRYPHITVDVIEVTPSPSTGHYHAKARINVRGDSQEVEGDVTISVDGGRLVVEGEKAIDMRAFGVQPPRLLMVKVEPEVLVRVRVTAQRQ